MSATPGQASCEGKPETRLHESEPNYLALDLEDLRKLGEDQAADWIAAVLYRENSSVERVTEVLKCLPKKGIDGAALRSMTRADFQGLGVIPGDAIKLGAHLDELRQAARAPAAVEGLALQNLVRTVELQAWTLDKMARNVDKLIRGTYLLKPQSSASASTRDPRFRQNVIRLQRSDQCLLLGNLYPLTNRAKAGAFPAVAAHIVPHREQELAGRLRIDLRSPTNGLMMSKHIEKVFDKYGLTLIPEQVEDIDDADVVLRIHVAQEYRDHVILDGCKEDSEPILVCDVRPTEASLVPRLTSGQEQGTSTPQRQITFGEIDKYRIRIKRVSLTCLFVHSTTAHEEHEDMPDTFSSDLLPNFRSCSPPGQRRVEMFYEKLQSPEPRGAASAETRAVAKSAATSSRSVSLASRGPSEGWRPSLRRSTSPSTGS